MKKGKTKNNIKNKSSIHEQKPDIFESQKLGKTIIKHKNETTLHHQQIAPRLQKRPM